MSKNINYNKSGGESETTGLISGDFPNQGFNLYLLAVCLVFVLSTFQFGYAIGVINTPQTVCNI
jgi:hypothetical protein